MEHIANIQELEEPKGEDTIHGIIELECCKRTDIRYEEIRNRHYIENKGSHGQQLHFIVWYNSKIVGIISGASSVYAVKTRDDFFGITKENRQKFFLPAIVNNSVFRLEYHEKNLATKVLSLWRRVTAKLWEEIYGVKVIGFETFVIETGYRKGTLYKADNWVYVGETAGNTKSHKGLLNPSTREETCKKLIYCKWIKGKPIIPTTPYISSWRGETPEEKQRAKELARMKKDILGRRFTKEF